MSETPSSHALTVTKSDGEVVVVYDPLPHQIKFHEATAPNVIMCGGRGSGKSKALRAEAIIRCLMYPGIRVLVLRREMPELRRTHLAEIEYELHLLGGEDVGTYHKTTFQVFFRNGSVLEFGHCESAEDVYKYLSAEYGAIYFDELASFDLTQFLQISASARSTKGSGRQAVVRGGTNPLGLGSGWIKEWFVDKSVDRDEFPFYNPDDFVALHSTFLDNPHLDQTAYRARLESLPAHQRKAWLSGEFSDEEQLFDFHRLKNGKPYHEIPELPSMGDGTPLLKQPWVRVYGVFDFGFYPDPAYFAWILVVGRRVIPFKEKVWFRTIAEDVARDILEETRTLGVRLSLTYCDPSIDLRTGADVHTIKEKMEAKGLPLQCSVNNREMYATAIHNALQTEIEPGLPQLQILQAGFGAGPGFGCPYLLKSLPAMKFDPKNPRAMADHAHDHAPIALAYFLMSHLPTTSPSSPRTTPTWMKPKKKDRHVLGRESVRQTR